MCKRLLKVFGLAALAGSTLLADFSYQETTTITGGALAGMMKIAGVFSKTAREPMQSTVMVKGDRMVHRSNNSLQIIDLGNQTITSVDLQKKTYTVMTFEQMKEMLDKAAQEMEKNKEKNKDKGEITWKVSAKATGKSRQFAGYDAKEMLLMMSMEGTDKESGQKGEMVVNTRLWLAPNVPGYEEMRSFQKRMAAKLNWTPNGNIVHGAARHRQGHGRGVERDSQATGRAGIPDDGDGRRGQHARRRSQGRTARRQKQAVPRQRARGRSGRPFRSGQKEAAGTAAASFRRQR